MVSRLETFSTVTRQGFEPLCSDLCMAKCETAPATADLRARAIPVLFDRAHFLEGGLCRQAFGGHRRRLLWRDEAGTGFFSGGQLSVAELRVRFRAFSLGILRYGRRRSAKGGRGRFRRDPGQRSQRG